MRRDAFVAEYAALAAGARRTGGKICFADEAHFRADADPVSGYGAGSAGEVGAARGTGLGGLHQPAPGRAGQLLFSGVSGDRRGGGAGTNGPRVTTTAPHPDAGAATATAFLRQLRARHTEPLTVIWDNAPARDWSKIWRRATDVADHAQFEPALGEPRIKYGAGSVPGHQGSGAREGGRLFHRSGQPARGSQTAMSDRPSSTDSRTDTERPNRFPPPCKCISHLGFS